MPSVKRLSQLFTSKPLEALVQQEQCLQWWIRHVTHRHQKSLPAVCIEQHSHQRPTTRELNCCTTNPATLTQGKRMHLQNSVPTPSCSPQTRIICRATATLPLAQMSAIVTSTSTPGSMLHSTSSVKLERAFIQPTAERAQDVMTFQQIMLHAFVSPKLDTLY